MLDVQNIVKTFNAGTVNEKIALRGVSLHLDPGDFVTVIGGNGAGKSTLMNSVAGVYGVDEGRITIDGVDITNLPEYKRAKYIGRVFQDPQKGSAASLTILENMALAYNKNKPYSLKPAISKKNIDYFKTRLEACKMGLEDRLDVRVGSLSGGQRQALALVIANMSDINTLILDEHTAALDPKSSERIMELTDMFVKENGVTALMVTHNLRFAVEYGSRLIMMDKGHIVLDKADEEKKNTSIDDILTLFNRISIECGN